MRIFKTHLYLSLGIRVLGFFERKGGDGVGDAGRCGDRILGGWIAARVQANPVLHETEQSQPKLIPQGMVP